MEVEIAVLLEVSHFCWERPVMRAISHVHAHFE